MDKKNKRRFSKKERITLFLAAQGKCLECGNFLAAGWHADHRQPWSKNGKTEIYNGQALCPNCNLIKSDKFPIEGISNASEK